MTERIPQQRSASLNGPPKAGPGRAPGHRHHRSIPLPASPTYVTACATDVTRRIAHEPIDRTQPLNALSRRLPRSGLNCWPPQPRPGAETSPRRILGEDVKPRSDLLTLNGVDQLTPNGPLAVCWDGDQPEGFCGAV